MGIVEANLHSPIISTKKCASLCGWPNSLGCFFLSFPILPKSEFRANSPLCHPTIQSTQPMNKFICLWAQKRWWPRWEGAMEGARTRAKSSLHSSSTSQSWALLPFYPSSGHHPPPNPNSPFPAATNFIVIRPRAAPFAPGEAFYAAAFHQPVALPFPFFCPLYAVLHCRRRHLVVIQLKKKHKMFSKQNHKLFRGKNIKLFEREKYKKWFGDKNINCFEGLDETQTGGIILSENTKQAELF